MLGCENFRRCALYRFGWARLAISACRVASVMDSVDIDVTELRGALPVMDDDDRLGLSESRLDTGGAKTLASMPELESRWTKFGWWW